VSQSDAFPRSPRVIRKGVVVPLFAGAWCNECPYAVRKLFALSEISGPLARRGRKRRVRRMTHLACPGVDGPAPSAVSRRTFELGRSTISLRSPARAARPRFLMRAGAGVAALSPVRPRLQSADSRCCAKGRWFIVDSRHAWFGNPACRKLFGARSSAPRSSRERSLSPRGASPGAGTYRGP
jgi:hypothetical protein